ncbi:MAG: hypothetical protein LBR96_01480 [Treponema sp.]|jgi:argininosuccinate lyase|nr:hypothetical protein [Treponema sp.]
MPCSSGFLEAADAAEYLVRMSLLFRMAHEAAARSIPGGPEPEEVLLQIEVLHKRILGT